MVLFIKIAAIIALGVWLLPESQQKPEPLDLSELPYLASPHTIPDPPTLYEEAGRQYGVPPALLEAIHQVESGKSGDRCPVSSAGAKGPMQFMPLTWVRYGVDGDGDGDRDICSVADSVHSAANYLAANYAKSGSWREAVYRYNHSWGYVNKVLRIWGEMGGRK